MINYIGIVTMFDNLAIVGVEKSHHNRLRGFWSPRTFGTYDKVSAHVHLIGKALIELSAALKLSSKKIL
jgi:hypothetical protein